MINKLISIPILLVGMTLTINGVVTKADDILSSASLAVNRVNINQFRTALELYYLDHNSYPDVVGGAAMFNALKRENYIEENAPIDPDEFNYQANNNGQDYLLELK